MSLIYNADETGKGIRKYISHNLGDLSAHMIYGDYLEERGKPRLAALSRQFPEIRQRAKDWTVRAIRYSRHAERDSRQSGYDPMTVGAAYGEAGEMHFHASRVHERVAKAALRLGHFALALHHGTMAARHDRYAYGWNEIPSPQDIRRAGNLLGRVGITDHALAAHYFGERRHNPELAALHNRAIEILQRPRGGR